MRAPYPPEINDLLFFRIVCGVVYGRQTPLPAAAPRKLAVLGLCAMSRADTQGSAAVLTDARQSRRHKVLKEGKILLQPPAGTIDVVIKDLSETGAQIAVKAALVLPPIFPLVMVADRRIVTCRQIWTKGLRVGLAFEGPMQDIGVRRF